MQRWDPSSIWPAPTPDAYESPKAVHSYASARLCSMLLLLLAPLGTSVAGRADVATRKEARKRRKVGAIVLNGGGESKNQSLKEIKERHQRERARIERERRIQRAPKKCR